MLLAILDIGIIMLLAVVVFRLIRKTEAMKIGLGLLMIFVTFFVADVMGMETTAFLFKRMLEVMAIGVIIIFHPELRILLKKIGNFADLPGQESETSLQVLKRTVFKLSRARTGALILLDNEERIDTITDSKVPIGAYITSKMLESIFFPNAPLHDGAVVIHGDRIAYANTKLPFSGKKREGMEHLGTRHSVAMENAELFGVTAVVVSEETGKVSVIDGKGMQPIINEQAFQAYFREKEAALEKRASKTAGLEWMFHRRKGKKKQ